MRRTAALIVGGGPAGSAAAIRLGRASVRAVVLERDRETRDLLCGGFLSWATIARLETLGVDPLALGARRVEGLALFAGERSAETCLPRPAAALSRRALDTALLARAESAGAGIERGVAARRFDRGCVRLDDAEIEAQCLVLATGKHDLRGIARPRAEGDAAVGLRWRLGSSPALTRLVDRRIELHLFRGGYAGLVLQEDGGANLCLAMRHSRFAELDRKPENVLKALAEECPALADRLAAAGSIGPASAIANIPYGWRARTTLPGVYRVGDQAGVIPSLAGEGISIALASGLAAADAIGRVDSAASFQTGFARRMARPLPLAGALWRAAEHPFGARALVSAVRTAPALADWASRLTRLI
jgi:flavin-dependent dehydrogenase